MTRTGFFNYALVIIIIVVSAGPILAQGLPQISFNLPEEKELVEGRTYAFLWSSSGIQSVSITATGDYVSIPERDWGSFSLAIADSLPAHTGGVEWTIPFLDTVDVLVTLKAFDDNGQLIDTREAHYTFRPAVLRDKTQDGIYIDVRTADKQRLYVLQGNRVIRAYLTSGSQSNEYYPRNVHPKKPHDHAGVFYIRSKYRNWFSRMFRVDMPWAMNYWGGHFIHATIPKYYQFLGGAASSGCNRLHWNDAKELYDMTPIGTRVEIIVK